MARDRLELIDLRELQRILGIGRTKAHSLIASGDIPSIRVGRSIRIDSRDLDAWLKRQTRFADN
jgi:excisionase family DNA binding protein